MFLAGRFQNRLFSLAVVIFAVVSIIYTIRNSPTLPELPHWRFDRLDKYFEDSSGIPGMVPELDGIDSDPDDITDAFFAKINSSDHENCRAYRQNYPIKTGRDGDMDLAFTITLSSDIRQVARIMRMIHRSNNYYCLHVEKKASVEFNAAVEGLVACFGKNVELVPLEKRIRLTVGSESDLRIQLVCAEQALERSESWKYLINLNEDEFPLRTNLEMVEALKALNGSNLVEALPISRFESWVNGKQLSLGATWYRGSSFGAYRREFLQAALTNASLEPLRKFLLEPVSIPHPEEIFFPILAYNPHLGLPGACRDAPTPSGEANLGFLAKFIIRSDYGINCSTKYVRFACVLGNEHLGMLNAAPHLFAAKFEVGFEPETYKELEKKYFERIKVEQRMRGVEFNTSVYAQRACSKNHF